MLIAIPTNECWAGTRPPNTHWWFARGPLRSSLCRVAGQLPV